MRAGRYCGFPLDAVPRPVSVLLHVLVNYLSSDGVCVVTTNAFFSACSIEFARDCLAVPPGGLATA